MRSTVCSWTPPRSEPELIAVTHDPIVSSDVTGLARSPILIDLQGTLAAGEKLTKLLAWHETLGHARRILDVAAFNTPGSMRKRQPGRHPDAQWQSMDSAESVAPVFRIAEAI